MKRSNPTLPLFLMCLALSACGPDPAGPAEARWWRGNTHTHTLWSDGDGAPELVAAEYRDAGYDFLVLSDHNVLSEGERWFPVASDAKSRLDPARVEALRVRFGVGAVTTRDTEGGTEMRLVTLAELRERFERPGEFLFIPGEEVTASWRDEAGRGHPVHVNGLNLDRLVPPQGGRSIRDVMNHNVDAIVEEGRRARRTVLAHVNHPNFGWALTWEDLAHVVNDRFFEVYNGHRGVRNHGDDRHPGTEEMWDRALTLRLTELDLGLLYGVATDDAHHYHGEPTAQMQRGWVMVRATELSPEAIVRAMQRGEFYASSGVVLDDVRREGDALVVDVRGTPGVTHTTRFSGTRRREGAFGPPGELLLETSGDPARYEFTGDELYVRAVVTSSRAHPNPFAEGDPERAWVQPVIP